MESTNTLGKYQIIREIARSNDIVYEATDPTLGRRVALKELYFPPNIDGAQKRERIERFMREGKAAARLEHPNIVTVYEIGQEGDRFFIAMEFLGGQTLRDTIKARGALPVKDAVDITLQLCEALALAHQNNIVHRDVKPENVQILPGGHVKLTDFGIARIMSEPSITANGQVFGTPSYMSPEQVSGRNIDGRSDIFSLGVLLYEMLTGQKPFAGDTVVTITYNIMNSEPPPPPGVQPHLVAIIRKAMAKDPNMRFQSVEEMADALKQEPANGATLYSDPYSPPMPQGIMTTYGTGSPPTTYAPPTTYSPPPSPSGGQYVPDPFSQSVPSSPVPTPIPQRKGMSPETRAFLGTLFIVLSLTGLLLLAIWMVTEAYSKYDEQTRTRIVTKYISQGDKLMKEGRVDDALVQYNNAKRAAGTGKAGAEARRRLAHVYADLAGKSLEQRQYRSLKQYASWTVDADPTYSAGHYYLGIADHYLGYSTYDAELRKAIETGGNDDFAQAARKRLCEIYINQGDRLASSNPEQAKSFYRKVAEDPLLFDPDWSPIAEQRLTDLNKQSG